MKVKIAITAMCLLLLAACRFFSSTNPVAPKAEADFPMIGEASIFSLDSVNSFSPSPEAYVYAHKLYLNAIDLFVNKKNPKESLPLFLRSIRTAPEAYTYLKYGDALYAVGQYDTAIKAYKFSFTNYGNSLGPDGQLGIARCYAIKGDTNAAMDELEYALSAYPFDVEAIRNDPAFEKYKDIERFKIVLVKYNTSDENRKTVLYGLFEKNFTKAALPYTIPPDSVNINNGTSIDFRYADFVDGMKDGAFSRSVQRDYQYMVALDLSPDYKAFVYRTVDVNGDSIFPVHHYLMTVDRDDSIISTQEIACACTPLTIKTATIGNDGTIEVKEIMQTWKEDPIYKGYAGNEVIKQEVKATTLYLVDATGTIKEIKERPATNSPAQASNEPEK